MPIDPKTAVSMASALAILLPTTVKVLSGKQQADQEKCLKRALPIMKEGHHAVEIALASGIPEVEVGSLTADLEILAQEYEKTEEDCLKLEQGQISLDAFTAKIGGHASELKECTTSVREEISRLKQHQHYKPPPMFALGDNVLDTDSNRVGEVIDVSHTDPMFNYKLQYISEVKGKPSGNWVSKAFVKPVPPSRRGSEDMEADSSKGRKALSIESNTEFLQAENTDPSIPHHPTRYSSSSYEKSQLSHGLPDDTEGLYVITADETRVSTECNRSSSQIKVVKKGKQVQIVEVHCLEEDGAEGQEHRLRGKLKDGGWITIYSQGQTKSRRFAMQENTPVHAWMSSLGTLLSTPSGQEEPTTKALGEATSLVALYPSALWCPPCLEFTPKLARAYEKLGQHSGLAVIFCSCDVDELSFQRYRWTQPWLAVPSSMGLGCGGLPSWLPKEMLHGVTGIPAMWVFEAKTGRVVSRSGREDVQAANYDLGACLRQWGLSKFDCPVNAQDLAEGSKDDLEFLVSDVLDKEVILHSLNSRPQFNGKIAIVKSFDHQARRFTVEVVDGSRVSVKPANFAQRCLARIRRDGTQCKILDYSPENQQYTVQHNDQTQSHLGIDSIFLFENTCIKLQGLKDEAYNSCMGKVICFDEEKARYTVQTERRNYISVKASNLLC